MFCSKTKHHENGEYVWKPNNLMGNYNILSTSGLLYVKLRHNGRHILVHYLLSRLRRTQCWPVSNKVDPENHNLMILVVFSYRYGWIRETRPHEKTGAWTMIDFIHSTQNIEDIRKSCCSSQGSFSFVFHYTARAVSGEHWWHWSNLSHIPTPTHFLEVYTRTWHPSLLKESIWVASSSEKPRQSVLPHSYSLLRLHSYSLPPEGLGSTVEISLQNIRRCWRICNFRSFFSDLPWPSPIAGIASSNAPRSAGGTLSSLESSLVQQSWSQTQCLQSQPVWAAAQRLWISLLSWLVNAKCQFPWVTIPLEKASTLKELH